MQEYNYVIDEIPPSNNKYIGRNARWEYKAEKHRWEELIYYTCRPRPKEPLKKSIVKIVYFFSDARRRDPDNYSGKFILDGLRKAGIILDDSFNNITLILGADIDRKKPRTEIKITEYSD